MSKSRAAMPDLQGSPTASAATYSTAVEDGDVVVSPETLPPSSSSRSRTDSEKRSLLHQAVHRLQLYAPPIESVRSVLDDFQDFIQQGNMIDLAIGLVLGKAFTDILNSFVVDILSPIMSLFSGEEAHSRNVSIASLLRIGNSQCYIACCCSSVVLMAIRAKHC